jgi:hypothetical protein
MIYPPAAVRFVCNALHGIAPLFMSGRGGGRRGKGGKAGAGRSGISCNAFTPAKRRSLQQKSGPRSTAKKTALANTLSCSVLCWLQAKKMNRSHQSQTPMRMKMVVMMTRALVVVQQQLQLNLIYLIETLYVHYADSI